ncbi:hypothetical protein LINPERHAP1_LOCUS11842 [Linum perenne]
MHKRWLKLLKILMVMSPNSGILLRAVEPF